MANDNAAELGSPRRRGRRRGKSDATETIRAAAIALFAEFGYEATSIRAIAARAGVDPALVHHYFGAKKQLHATVLQLSDTERLSDHLIAQVVGGEVEALVRDVLSAWDDPATRPMMLARLRSAVGAGAASGDYLGALIRPHAIPGPVPETSEVVRQQVGTVTALLVGMVIARYVLKIDPLASAAAEDAVSTWAPMLRALLEIPG